jgi:magnesium transporter
MATTGRCYRGGTLTDEHVDPSAVAQILADPSCVLWLDIADPTDADFVFLAREFGVHELAIEDMHHRHQRPKVDVFPDHYFVVTRPLLQDEDGAVRESELHAIAGDRYLVTLRFSPAFDLRETLARWDRQPELVADGTAFMLYVVVDEIVDGYLDMVEAFEERADELEDQVFDERPADDDRRQVQQELFRLKRDVVTFRREVMPLRRALDFFQEQPSYVTPGLLPYYRDVSDHVVRSVELADNIRDLLTSLLEVRVAQVANHLNEVMKKLTSWAAIILIPTLIAGVYGMNFRHMPELSWTMGYPIAIGSMLAASGALYLVFKRRSWL